jgi:hypothetical protein
LDGCRKFVGTAAGVKASVEVNDILDVDEVGMVSLNEVNDVLNADPMSLKEPDSFLATDEVGMISLDEVNDVFNADPMSVKEPGSFLATDEVGVVSLDEVKDILDADMMSSIELDDRLDTDAVGMVSLDEVNDILEGDMVSLKEYDMLDIDEIDMVSLKDEREVLGKDWIAMACSSELISDPVYAVSDPGTGDPVTAREETVVDVDDMVVHGEATERASSADVGDIVDFHDVGDGICDSGGESTELTVEWEVPLVIGNCRRSRATSSPLAGLDLPGA